MQYCTAREHYARKIEAPLRGITIELYDPCETLETPFLGAQWGLSDHLMVLCYSSLAQCKQDPSKK